MVTNKRKAGAMQVSDSEVQAAEVRWALVVGAVTVKKLEG
jgi:hypothetical protein